MDQYIKGEKIGEGSYGTIWQATHRESGETVALKKIRCQNVADGLPKHCVRELKALRELQHDNIVKLLDVVLHKESVVLVFEHLQNDLEALIKDDNFVLTLSHIKAYMVMVLESLAYLHSHGVVHRDVKTDNFLVTHDGQLKLADFGLAKFLPEAPANMTPQVYARWYQPPEILLGSARYDSSADMWAAGCVLAELLLRRPLFKGVSDMAQLIEIFALLGTPDIDSWPEVQELDNYMPLHPMPPQDLGSVLPQAPPELLDLLRQLLVMNPCRRLSAEEALQHRCFTTGCAPAPRSCLPPPCTRAAKRRPERAPLCELSVQQLLLPRGGLHVMQHSEERQNMRPPRSRPSSLAQVPEFSCGSGGGHVTAAESACPMSLGTSALRKRSRALFMSGSSCADPRPPSCAAAPTPATSRSNDTPPDKRLHMSVDGGVPSSIGLPGGSTWNGLSSGDRRYLRRKALELDVLLDEASQDSVWDSQDADGGGDAGQCTCAPAEVQA